MKALASRALAWAKARPRLLLYAASLALQLALAPFFIHDWDGYVFVQATRDFLHDLTPYMAVESEAPHVYIGDGVPIVNQWYAYPPLPLLLWTPFFALLTSVSPEAWVARMGIKVPLIVGNLVLAYVSGKLVGRILERRGDASAQKVARRVELAMLFNPFLIFVGAIWGMFDAWMMAFLLFSVYLLMSDRFGSAGVAYAAAALVKLFPAFVGPFFLAYALRRGGLRGGARFVGWGGLFGVLVCLPFFVTAPSGFLEQLILMHTARPPQGFTLLGIPLAFGWLNGLMGTSLPTDISPEAISRLSGLATFALVSLLWIQSSRVRDPETLLHLSLVTLAGVLVLGKVVNEQYFVMPAVLGIVCFAVSGRDLHRGLGRAYTVGGLISATILGWHFLTFLPPDVAEKVFPFDPLQALPRLVRWLGWTDEQAYIYPTLLAALSLVPALLLSLRLVGEEAMASARLALRHLRLRPARAAPVAAVFLAFAFLLPATSGIFGATVGPAAAAPPAVTTPPLVAVVYDLGWNNPAHDPTIEYGTWRVGVSQIPQEGYYSISAGKIRDDFRSMRASGIDVVVVSYHAYDRPKLPAIFRLASETGLVVAPMLELRDVAGNTDNRPRDADGNALPEAYGLALRDNVRDAIARTTEPLFAEFGRHPGWLRLDGRPVLLLHDVEIAWYDRVGEVRGRMVAAAAELSGRTLAQAEAAFPLDDDAFLAPTPEGRLWRMAYERVYVDFWAGTRAAMEAKAGPLYLAGSGRWSSEFPLTRGASISIHGQGVFDTTFEDAPASTWLLHIGEPHAVAIARWLDEQSLLAQHQRAAGRLVISSVSPGFNDHGRRVAYQADGRWTYDVLWEDAIRRSSDLVLVSSWNRFQEGTAIEPTVGLGDALLRKTAAHAATLKDAAGPDPAHRVLLVTDTLDGGPDALPLAARRLWAFDVDRVEWNGPLLEDVNLARYQLVIVDAGAHPARTEAAAILPARLEAYARAGGHVLLLGGASFAGLQVGATLGPLGGPVRLETALGPAPLPPEAGPRLHELPPQATTYLWMSNATLRAPAAWSIPLGAGALAATAFGPTGEANAAAEALRLAAAPLLTEARS